MRTLKVKTIGFWKDFDLDSNLLFQLIKKHYNVELTDDPDYVVCSIFGEHYEYLKYPQVRILFSGENYIPDFNLIDYAVSSYPIEFLDRHLCLPSFLNDISGFSVSLATKNRDYPDRILKQKPYFANFIASHDSEHNLRGDFFKQLCSYKPIQSPGTYLNNIEVSPALNHIDGSKIEFQRKCKFSLCFESTVHEGFITEKITDAFFADTIPVYLGSSTVKSIFNEKAFINVADYDSFDDAIERIIELDQNDEEYLKMLRQPVFADKDYIGSRIQALDDFVLNIFEQPLEKAFRRSRVYAPLEYEYYLHYLKEIQTKYNNSTVVENLSGRDMLKLLNKKIWNRFHT